MTRIKIKKFNNSTFPQTILASPFTPDNKTVESHKQNRLSR